MAEETIVLDQNGRPVLAAVNPSGEVMNLRCDSDGVLEVVEE